MPPVLELPEGKQGVLPAHWLRQAIAAGVIHADDEIPDSNIQPASLDLRLSDVAYRLQCSFLPNDRTVEGKLRSLGFTKVRIPKKGLVLEPRTPYLIPLMEGLDLPEGLRAKANPKSSTGRADVFTRVITDHGHRFDEIAPGYSGRLYLEVVPLSFPVVVKQGLTLNQLRLSQGATDLRDDDLREASRKEALLYRDGKAVPADELELSNGLLLGLDLEHAALGHKAQPHAPVLDLTSRLNDRAAFWDPVSIREGDRLILSPGEFYLLMSREAVVIPPTLAAEMTAYDPTSGELRTHYAGFFDPGFGFDRSRQAMGSTAALEVRAHDVPFLVEHGQPVCKLTFERMLEPPEALYGEEVASNYQGQTETLGKHFRPPEAESATKAPRFNQIDLFGDDL